MIKESTWAKNHYPPCKWKTMVDFTNSDLKQFFSKIFLVVYAFFVMVFLQAYSSINTGSDGLLEQYVFFLLVIVDKLPTT